MNQCYIFQLFLVFLLLIIFITGRTLHYDQSDENDNSKSISNEDEDKQDHDSKSSNSLDDNDNIYDDNRSFDSYEEKKFHRRGLFSSSRASHTLSPHTRQAIIDILQKAFDQGWRPNLKHYIPATRFGRHRR